MSRPSIFQRLILPGFAFKAVVIGGGYATGRELVEFFFQAGPRGGLLGLTVTAILWSLVCAMTFLVAQATRSFDYRSFFKVLLGRGWPVFEVAYILLMLLILSVFGAAAGEIFQTAFGLPALAGTILLMVLIVAVTTAGRSSMEQMFKYVSIFLYAVYAIFVTLALWNFGDRVSAALALDVGAGDWFGSGLTYAGYNLVGAIVILPMTRHIVGRRDAIVAGLLCGPLAILPAMLFFLCLLAFYPEIGQATLPSDVMLTALRLPVFHLVFQAMIMAALLESGAGLVFALNERIASALSARGRAMGAKARLAVSSIVLLFAVAIAGRIGLVALIAQGYSTSAYVFLMIYVVPLFVVGGFVLIRGRNMATDQSSSREVGKDLS